MLLFLPVQCLRLMFISRLLCQASACRLMFISYLLCRFLCAKILSRADEKCLAAGSARSSGSKTTAHKGRRFLHPPRAISQRRWRGFRGSG
jgi:hypothetical protein